ncbi:hypothetical protein MAPG_03356 [Magnaporthiopsis poae ATCC 64411]|uniref:Uncharacterized protein n=1 Tax=Magnaporthiopsis poae (strain ATCC 64411 / 73-15) TaxID=644358 RepID=A0A0C4DTT2_MAGP6|nr:hypothetical protein MAPG_03356 [Magnaporthiopsis poae ATCC 64411]
MSPTHLGLHHLTEDQIDDLAGLLYMAPRHMYDDGQPRGSWLKHQEKKMKRTTFPKRLRRPKGALNWLRLRVAEKTGWTHEEMLPQLADLCEVHQRGLNPWLIHDIFNLLHDESTLRTTRIRNHKSDLHTTEVADFVTRLSGLTSLWLSPKKFENLFARGGVFPDWARFRQLGNAVEHPYEDGDDSDDGTSTVVTESVSNEKDEQPRRRRSCEACILAVVGGRPDILTALRANLIGPRPARRMATSRPTLSP